MSCTVPPVKIIDASHSAYIVPAKNLPKTAVQTNYNAVPSSKAYPFLPGTEHTDVGDVCDYIGDRISQMRESYAKIMGITPEMAEVETYPKPQFEYLHTVLPRGTDFSTALSTLDIRSHGLSSIKSAQDDVRSQALRIGRELQDSSSHSYYIIPVKKGQSEAVSSSMIHSQSVSRPRSSSISKAQISKSSRSKSSRRTKKRKGSVKSEKVKIMSDYKTLKRDIKHPLHSQQTPYYLETPRSCLGSSGSSQLFAPKREGMKHFLARKRREEHDMLLRNRNMAKIQSKKKSSK
ncbi:hypothetical protein ADUPG1_008428 [Aduncisulcus paluster]|uniref:Uncharacterized protein n=1 Tax=Aduncisulcus paluster TaxID=2918883 RepID=A0ABQ5KRY1_9EUKA|nr:hypothetical protein ADUPG1_008428 [Aduncisulcus paluster]